MGNTVINENETTGFSVTPTGITIGGKVKEYATYEAMLAETNPPKYASVVDASADPSVGSGSAFYKYSNGTWVKVHESESNDITWDTLEGKPDISSEEFITLVNNSHAHANIGILNKFSADPETGKLLYNGVAIEGNDDIIITGIEERISVIETIVDAHGITISNINTSMVKSVNGITPDNNGNVTIPIDITDGTVKSVNGVGPDSEGNVSIPVGDITADDPVFIALAGRVIVAETAISTLEENNHNHSNKSVLDQLSVSNGQLQLNGVNVDSTADLSGYATKEDVSNAIKTITIPSDVSDLTDNQGLLGVSSWNNITDKPQTFTPSAHNHVVSDISNLSIPGDLSDLTDNTNILAGKQNAITGTEGQFVVIDATGSAVAETIDLSEFGSVKTVNGNSPDAQGNVTVTTDLSNYYTKSETSSEIEKAIDSRYYTAWEVYPTDAPIAAKSAELGTVVFGDSALKVSTAIVASSTEEFSIWLTKYRNIADVVIDWGDGTVESVTDLAPTGYTEYGTDATEIADRYSMLYVAHTYSVPNTKYIIKVYGKDYVRISHNASKLASGNTNKLLCRMLDKDLPIAPHLKNLASFALGCTRLLKVNASSVDMSSVDNFSSLCSGCSNLLIFSGIGTRYNQAAATSNMFASCAKMVYSDVSVPSNSAVISAMYNGCYALEVSITNLLPAFGFNSNQSINVNALFRYCRNLTDANSTILGKYFWNNPNVTWTNITNVFSDSDQAINAGLNKVVEFVPTSWGGTASDDLISPKLTTTVASLEEVKHTHSNKTVLDKFGESNGSVTYNGTAISDSSSASHISNSDIHVTSADKTKWNATSTDFDTHKVDTYIHLTEEDRGILQEVPNMTMHIGSSDVHVTPTDKQTWSGKQDVITGSEGQFVKINAQGDAEAVTVTIPSVEGLASTTYVDNSVSAVETQVSNLAGTVSDNSASIATLQGISASNVVTVSELGSRVTVLESIQSGIKQTVNLTANSAIADFSVTDKWKISDTTGTITPSPRNFVDGSEVYIVMYEGTIVDWSAFSGNNTDTDQAANQFSGLAWVNNVAPSNTTTFATGEGFQLIKLIVVGNFVVGQVIVDTCTEAESTPTTV